MHVCTTTTNCTSPASSLNFHSREPKGTVTLNAHHRWPLTAWLHLTEKRSCNCKSRANTHCSKRASIQSTNTEVSTEQTIMACLKNIHAWMLHCIIIPYSGKFSRGKNFKNWLKMAWIYFREFNFRESGFAHVRTSMYMGIPLHL